MDVDNMAWKRLNIDDLRLLLSEGEAKQLNEYSLQSDITSVVDDTIDMVSDMWRGALRAKGYAMDIREHYTPSSYHYYILVHARHAVWTRFPFSTDVALDERRREEYDEAVKLLKDPYINVDAVDDEEGQDSAEEAVGTGGGSIRVPWNRFPPWYMVGTGESLNLGNYF